MFKYNFIDDAGKNWGQGVLVDSTPDINIKYYTPTALNKFTELPSSDLSSVASGPWDGLKELALVQYQGGYRFFIDIEDCDELYPELVGKRSPANSWSQCDANRKLYDNDPWVTLSIFYETPQYISFKSIYEGTACGFVIDEIETEQSQDQNLVVNDLNDEDGTVDYSETYDTGKTDWAGGSSQEDTLSSISDYILTEPLTVFLVAVVILLGLFVILKKFG